jgi:large repetitive protein
VLYVPTITSFSPSSSVQGSSVVITGTNFLGATAVNFNSATTANFTVNSATQITAIVNQPALSGPIKVVTPGGTATSAGSFLVLPKINSLIPVKGAVGANVTINGSGFTGATAVKFNGISASFTVNSANQITSTIPSGAASGFLSVTTPSGIANSPTTFTVTPQITGFSPGSGAQDSRVVLTGTSFQGATAVKFNTSASASFTINSPTQITAIVNQTALSGPIKIVTPAGTATSAGSFLVLPKINSLTPTKGAVGASVTISGSGFTGATAVKLNGTTASFTLMSSTQITATVPSGASTGPITVSTANGTATSNAFTVTP